MIQRIALLMFFLCMAIPAHADPDNIDIGTPSSTAANKAHNEDYIPASWPDLLRTMVRFNALDLNDQNLLDGFAAVTECDLYQFYYNDDFKWNQVRKTISDSAMMNSTTYPVYYYFVTELHLDRYDFKENLFRFAEKSVVKNVNLFRLYDVEGSQCGDDATQYMPKSFQAVADKTLNMEGIPLQPADAQAVLREMNDDKNVNRMVFMKVNLTVTYIARLHKEMLDSGTSSKKPLYFQLKEKENRLVRLDVRVDSVNFYEDPRLSKLIYSFKPES